MMPKGVEHYSMVGGVATQIGVKIPMMPKGVEHCRAVEDPRRVAQDMRGPLHAPCSDVQRGNGFGLKGANWPL